MGICFFCESCENKKYILENHLAYALFDQFPVSKGHMIFATKRHVETFFDITSEECSALFELISKAKIMLDDKFKPDGYNIGVNCGNAGGQFVMHTHVHLIPRYIGDVENPRGGVRAVIPQNKNYTPNKKYE